MLLKAPYDPFVERIKDERGDYIVTRSSAFNGIGTSDEVHQAAKQLFSCLNVVVSTNVHTDPVTNGAVVEFVSGGPPCRRHHLEAKILELPPPRLGIPQLTVKDAQGDVIEPPQAPSRPQLWMCAAALEPEIGNALRYLQGTPGWFELYKAYEALRNMPNSRVSKEEIRRFTQTANAEERHHPSRKNKPHERPMELWEARLLMDQWISAAIDDVLAMNQENIRFLSVNERYFT